VAEVRDKIDHPTWGWRDFDECVAAIHELSVLVAAYRLQRDLDAGGS
jgi:hypothetical protein